MPDKTTNDAMVMARKLIQGRFPGINEAEAIAYSRGIAKGLLMAGCSHEKAKQLMIFEATRDNLLEAGATYTAQNMIENIIAVEKGEKQ